MKRLLLFILLVFITLMALGQVSKTDSLPWKAVHKSLSFHDDTIVFPSLLHPIQSFNNTYKSIYFGSSVFKTAAFFYDSRITDETWFTNDEFPDGALFSDCHFIGIVRFWDDELKFNDFELSVFESLSEFDRCHFGKQLLAEG